MSLTVLETLKQNEIFTSEKELSKFNLSTSTSLQPIISSEAIFTSEDVQIEERFCSSEDMNPDQNDAHDEGDCTEDEEDLENIKNPQQTEQCNKQCCANLQENPSAPSQIDKLDEQSSFPLDQILPCIVGNLRIKKLTWLDFSGTPNYDLKWSAHAFWGINYTYTVQQKAAKNKKVSYIIKPEVNVWLKKKSWAKKQNPHLLNHEQGHYILGCFCGLEFKKQMMSYNFTDNYRFEIPRLFDKILKDHIALEKKYDKETNHRLNREKQTEWDNYMLQKLQDYQKYFQKTAATPQNKVKVNKIQ
ncbi:hypothetical protein ABPG74_013303 [Tetrahymena malaccensis]